MDKEATMKQLQTVEDNIRETRARLCSKTESIPASALEMDLGMYERRYKRALLDLTPDECVEIKMYAEQQGVKLEFFDIYIPTAEERAEHERSLKAIEEFEARESQNPEYIKMQQAALEDLHSIFEPKKKKGLFGLFGKK